MVTVAELSHFVEAAGFWCESDWLFFSFLGMIVVTMASREWKAQLDSAVEVELLKRQRNNWLNACLHFEPTMVQISDIFEST